jgi:hypothetical protein
LRGKRYNAEKKSEGAPSGNQNATKQLDQNDPVVSTADRLATEYKVSAPTIKTALSIRPVFKKGQWEGNQRS